jgi:nitrite reductase/ring-hydroxylating ferredoxin subunit
MCVVLLPEGRRFRLVLGAGSVAGDRPALPLPKNAPCHAGRGFRFGPRRGAPMRCMRVEFQLGSGQIKNLPNKSARRSPALRIAAVTAKKATEGGFVRMAEQFIGKLSEFNDGDRRIVFLGDIEIGVFRHEGKFFAYSNYCLHQGGPVCEGLTIAKVEERLMPDKTSRGMYFSDTEMHFVCPWHGYEYDMKSGECVSDRRLKLRKYKVVEKGDDVYVIA